MAITNSALYSNLDKLREDLANKAATEVKTLKTDYGSEALLNDLYGEINSEQEYDVTKDPAYAGMKKAAFREADRTMRDTLAQGNAKSNGFTNSAAITAASQARDYTMSQFDDNVAALEDRALSKQNAKISTKMQLLTALEGMEAQKRQTYLDDLALLEDTANAQKSAAENEAKNIISMGGIPSDELMAKAGWSQEYIKTVRQSAIDNMDTVAMQKYLNRLGAGLAVDGVWGSATEAAYKKAFGKASGRLQTSSGSSGGGSYSGGSRSSGSSSKKSTAKSTTTSKTSSASYKSSELLQAAAAGMSKAQIEKQLKARGVDTSKASVQADIKWALSK